MKIVLLSSKYSFPSAKILGGILKDRGLEIRITTKDFNLKVNPEIRYGNSTKILDGADTLVNSPLAIQTMSNKMKFSELLIKEEIPTPKFQRITRESLPQKYPALIRETLTGAGGVGIFVVENEEELLKHLNFWWTEFVPLEFELRIHVVEGKPVKIFKKMFAGENPEEKYPIRNLKRGYHFQLRDALVYKKVPELVEKVQKALPEGSFFYALDIGWNPEKREYFVLEANSAPGLNINTATLYAEAISKKILEKL